jgi:lipoprotein NlpD
LSLAAVLAGCTASWQAPLENRGSQPAARHANPASRPAPPIRAKSYRVRRGDTLYSIAWRAGRDFRSLARWNRIPPPYTIYPGQLLTLVPQSRPASAASQARRSPAAPASKPPAPAASQPRPKAQPAPSSKPAQPTGPLRWHWPAGGPLLSSYSAKDPSRKGIKIGGRPGQPVRAAEGGRVVYSGSGLIGYGQLIIIKHNDTYLSAYGHNAKLLVKEGEQVARGKHIADMGRSNDGKPMLHFEIRRDGRPVDPLGLLPRR